jgi:hypothetical protein
MTNDRGEPPPDPDDREFDALRDRLDALQAQHEKLKARMIASAKEKAGALYETMQQGPRVAERFFDHPDPNLRLAALKMFCIHWDLDERFGDACERLAWTDSDEEVRAAAIDHLGWRYWETSDFRIGGFLAEIVHDETQDASVRRMAYLSLYQIRGRSVLERPSRKDFRFPEDVDWSLVGVFLKEDY